MPYIEKQNRPHYDKATEEIINSLADGGWNAGHVTYVFYRIIVAWFKSIPRYDTICKIRGVLVGTMDEFNVRWAEAYENQKIVDNGDVR